ncbi:hypothetical protein AWE51_06560 [Aquimarina aggregata]|uniref:Uncharacterized protein n=1 Tax=Aquimarina aggregata TaxID=1642818 RepID=A0A163AKC0_9FLAO|nr:hypothetical protein AWE51_06560 [Aquimarina aggregata]
MKNILIFQKKIFFISYLTSIAIGILGFLFTGFINHQTIGLGFSLIVPFAQYYVYDIKNKNQYFYYYNLGLSNIMLWVSTFITALINFFILIII